MCHSFAWLCFLILAAAAGAVTLVLILRLWIVLRSQDVMPRKSLSLLIVAGSGGHTTEILRLLGSLSSAYSPRHYIFADTDTMSANKINSFELARVDRDSSAMCSDYHIHRIPRSREVHQSWLSTVRSTLRSLLLSFPLVHRIKPDLWLRITSLRQRGFWTDTWFPDYLLEEIKPSDHALTGCCDQGFTWVLLTDGAPPGSEAQLTQSPPPQNPSYNMPHAWATSHPHLFSHGM